MNDAIDRTLADWLSEGPERGPRHGLERALAATRRTSQRPGWTFAERWLPMQLTMRAAVVPRAAYLLLLAALAIALFGAAAFLIGSRQDVAPSFGLARNGAVVIGINGALWRAHPDGRPGEKLDLGFSRVSNPTFSPDGSRLAFLARPGDVGASSLFISRADGSEPVNVTPDMPVIGEPLETLAWSPDGSKIAFSSMDKGKARLYVAATDGSGTAPITEPDADRTLPAWSPTGDWIAYRLARPSSVHLAVIRPDGSGEKTLVDEAGTFASFSGSTWSPDGNRLAYFSRSGLGHVVEVVDLERNEQTISLAGEDAYNAAWSPDGRRLVYSRAVGGSVVVTLADDARLPIPPPFANDGAAWAPDGTALLGLGGETLYLIPLDDPTRAAPLRVPSGAVDNTTWQRLAP